MAIKTSCIAVLVACLGVSSAFAQKTTPRFKVIAFYTGKADAAHISFVKEARPWFARMAAEHHFSFESTQNWDNLNREFLAPYQVVVFLDTRPDSPRQREAFQEYMKNGGAFLDGLSLLSAFSRGSLPRNIRRTGTGITYNESPWAPACMSGTHGDPPRRSFGWRTPSTPRPSDCRPLSRVPPTNGTSGPRI